MHAEDGARLRGDGRGDQRGIHAVADRLDVDEDRRRAALVDGVGAGNEGVADGDDLVTRAHADGKQSEMQRRGAVGDGAGVGRAGDGGELFFEARDARTLCQPAGTHDLGRSKGFLLTDKGLGDGDHAAAPASAVSERHQAASLAMPSSRGCVASKPISSRAFETSARRFGTGFTARAS